MTDANWATEEVTSRRMGRAMILGMAVLMAVPGLNFVVIPLFYAAMLGRAIWHAKRAYMMSFAVIVLGALHFLALLETLRFLGSEGSTPYVISGIVSVIAYLASTQVLERLIRLR